jgi:hypothetical protein
VWRAHQRVRHLVRDHHQVRVEAREERAQEHQPDDRPPRALLEQVRQRARDRALAADVGELHGVQYVGHDEDVGVEAAGKGGQRGALEDVGVV